MAALCKYIIDGPISENIIYPLESANLCSESNVKPAGYIWYMAGPIMPFNILRLVCQL